MASIKLWRCSPCLVVLASVISQVLGECPPATKAEQEAWESIVLKKLDVAGEYDKTYRLVGPGKATSITTNSQQNCYYFNVQAVQANNEIFALTSDCLVKILCRW